MLLTRGTIPPVLPTEPTARFTAIPAIQLPDSIQEFREEVLLLVASPPQKGTKVRREVIRLHTKRWHLHTMFGLLPVTLYTVGVNTLRGLELFAVVDSPVLIA